MSLCPEFVVVTWLARKLRTSVAWSEDRRENLVAGFHSRDQHIALAGAFDAEARLIALSADVLANVGAYSCYPTTCGVEPLMALAEMPGPYDVREYACVSRGVLTHTCPMAPYRGVSRPVITFAIERLMDKAAAAFALDPIAIRRRNLVNTFPYQTATGLVLIPLGGVKLAVDGRAVDPAKTFLYKGMMYSDVPNLASVFGYTNASWTLKADLVCEYVCRLINHMDRGGYRQCTPRNADPTLAEEPWVNFSSGYIQRALAKQPKQGSKRPWKLYQNYALDLLSLRFGSVRDQAMVFSGQVNERVTVPNAPKSAT
jgi:hypothetical protein